MKPDNRDVMAGLPPRPLPRPRISILAKRERKECHRGMGVAQDAVVDLLGLGDLCFSLLELANDSSLCEPSIQSNVSIFVSFGQMSLHCNKHISQSDWPDPNLATQILSGING